MRDDDPTKMNTQSSLTTSTGTIWLVTGGLMTVISVVLLWAMQQLDSRGVALLAIVVLLLLYVAMVEIRLLVRRLRTRLLLMAVVFGAIALVALAAVVAIGTSEAFPA
ncbi:hypothetical protein [Herbiconiux sp. YIM B11900]|uniref:hypothetical protein n=1 Tax=Herbiconiux sp. YIM B11900 TaxID=3404131 RepID=UPI003F836D09